LIDPEGHTGVLLPTESTAGDQNSGLTIATKIVDESVSGNVAEGHLAKAKRHTEPLAHIGYDVGGRLRFERDVPRLPIEVLHMIGENDP
jgi:hypothetical protein